MATKDKPKADPNANLYGQVANDFTEATKFYNQYIPHHALGRLDPTRSTESQNLVNLRRGYADPGSASFAGKYSPDALEVLNTYKSRLNPNSVNYAGRTSTATQELLDKRRAGAMGGYQRSNDMLDIVNRFKSGLGGYTAAENTALREQGTRGIRANAAADAARNAAAGARMGVRGANAMAQMRNDQRATRGALDQFDQDLFVRNVDEKSRRLNEYAGFMSGLEADEFGRSQGLLNDYQSLLRDTESTNYNRTADALRDYSSIQGTIDDRYYGRAKGAIDDYQSLVSNLEEIERAINTFNIGQGEKEQARDVGSLTSIVGLLNTIRNQNAQNAILAKK